MILTSSERSLLSKGRFAGTSSKALGKEQTESRSSMHNVFLTAKPTLAYSPASNQNPVIQSLQYSSCLAWLVCLCNIHSMEVQTAGLQVSFTAQKHPEPGGMSHSHMNAKPVCCLCQPFENNNSTALPRPHWFVSPHISFLMAPFQNQA